MGHPFRGFAIGSNPYMGHTDYRRRSRRQLEEAFAPLLEYLEADGLRREEAGARHPASFRRQGPDSLPLPDREIVALPGALEPRSQPWPYVEAVEVDVTTYLENGEQESKLLFVGPTAQAIHEAQRRCMIEDVAAILERQFEKNEVAQVTALVNEMFDRDWKAKASQEKKPERAFETYTRPSRKNLH